MGLSASLADYLKKMTHKHENVTSKLNMKHKQMQGIYPMVIYAPWADSFIHN